jgi:ABC-type transport system involved in cytochrome c biogenesis permease subunit
MSAPAQPATPRIPRTSVWFGIAAIAAVVATQTYSIANSPAEADMGHLQKIMYVHVPAAWMAFLAFAVVFIFSVRYLWNARENDDLLAASAAEVGALFTGLTLVLGMLWGRPTWGVWWAWDARLTSTLVQGLPGEARGAALLSDRVPVPLDDVAADQDAAAVGVQPEVHRGDS